MTDRDKTHTERARTNPSRAEPTRTEPSRAESARTKRTTLSDVDHTHPYTGESFGRTQTYSRGRIIAADGGEASGARRRSSDAEASDGEETDATDRPADADDEENGDGSATAGETLGDVDHEPPKDADQANRAYQRGNEDAV